MSKLFIPVIFFGILLSGCQSSDVDPGPDPNANNNNTGNDPNNTTENPGTTNDAIGEKAPGFTLLSTYGDSISLADFKDRVVVLFFLGNTCPSCRSVGPSVEQELGGAYSDNPHYKILGLDQWDGNKASLQSFRDATHVTFPLLLNASGVALDYQTTYDRLVVVDKEGKIAFKGEMSTYNDLDAVKELVQSLLENI